MNTAQNTTSKSKAPVRKGKPARAAKPAPKKAITKSKAPAPKTKAKAAPAATAAVVKTAHKGITQPKPGGACATVWNWCDAHPNATVAEVKAGLENKVNPSTCSVQFYRWKKYNA